MHTYLIDSHLHLYPNYDLPKALNQLLDSSAKFDSKTQRIACLAERHDCDFYESIASGKTKLNGFKLSLPNTDGQNDDQYIELIREHDQARLSLLPGRQVISKENIEILTLVSKEKIEDGQPALDIIYQCNRNDGVPVVAWSPGKWFGKRGELVKHLLREFKPGDFMIGDTTLRPYGWPTPRLMQVASNMGYGVIAGSDPLPFKGEEDWLGAYYSVVESDRAYAADDLLKAMKSREKSLRWQNKGKRCNGISLLNRLRKNAASKKR